MNLSDLKKDFEYLGLGFDEIQNTYLELESRREPDIKVVKGGIIGDRERIRGYALALRQVLLHRTFKLYEGAIESLISNNGYAMVLSIRGNYEATAALGYLHNRLVSLKNGNLNSDEVDLNITAQILGSRDKQILDLDGYDAVDAIQIMKMLQYADKSISQYILNGKAKEHRVLTEHYEWLCEFCHPNFHSNTLAFDLDKEKEAFIFRHDLPLRDRDAKIFEYILLSTDIFITLFDQITELIPE